MNVTAMKSEIMNVIDQALSKQGPATGSWSVSRPAPHVVQVVVRDAGGAQYFEVRVRAPL